MEFVTAVRLVMSVSIALLTVGCMGDDASAPRSLSDGSPAHPPPVELQGVDEPTVATRLRVVPLSSIPSGSALADCVRGTRPTPGIAVERVDVRGRSISYVGASGQAAFACDYVPSPSDTDASWCGRAFGRLVQGRLSDPRLSLGCEESEDEPVGYAWVQPAAETAYVVLEHAGYSESYLVKSVVPVRVRTDDVDVPSSTARFEVSEHARDGRRLRAYELEAAVSG